MIHCHKAQCTLLDTGSSMGYIEHNEADSNDTNAEGISSFPLDEGLIDRLEEMEIDEALVFNNRNLLFWNINFDTPATSFIAGCQSFSGSKGLPRHCQ